MADITPPHYFGTSVSMVQNAKKNEKHKNDHSKLLAKQKLMKLDKNNIHINKPKKSESVG
jgi:hypothetical protein